MGDLTKVHICLPKLLSNTGFITICNLQGDKQLNLFGILLKGLAANWYESLGAAQKPDYLTVKTYFQSLFQGTNSNVLNQQKLENVKI